MKYILARYPRIKDFQSGDPRAVSKEGWDEIFVSSGFETAQEKDFTLQFWLNPPDLWHFMKNMYFTAILPDEDRTRLQKEVDELAKTKVSSNGKVLFEFPMRMLTVTFK